MKSKTGDCSHKQPPANDKSKSVTPRNLARALKQSTVGGFFALPKSLIDVIARRKLSDGTTLH